MLSTGEARGVPHSPLRASRLSKPVARHDRGVAGETTYGECHHHYHYHYHCHHHHYQRVQLFAKRMQPRKIIMVIASQLKEVNRHPWVIAGGKGEMDLEDPMMEVS